MSSVQESILENKLRVAKFHYYHKQPIMTDAQYDALEDELRKLNPSNLVLKETGAPANLNSPWAQARHSVPMTSLSKAMNMKEFEEWWVAQHVTEAYISEKQDGISLSITYENGKLVQAIVRGDGIMGDDITANVLKMKGVRLQLTEPKTCIVRGEIRMSKSNLETARKTRPEKHYANCRNTASGLSREKDGELSHLLDFVSYELLGTGCLTETIKFEALQSLGFVVSPGKSVTTINEVKDLYESYQAGRREKLDYDIDGLVIKVNSMSVQDEAGTNAEGKPIAAIALKFTPRVGVTIINNIRWEVADSGRFCPVAEVVPIELDGATVRNVSLYNMDFVLMHEVTIGSEVEICRQGDIIPYLIRVTKPGLPFWKK